MHVVYSQPSCMRVVYSLPSCMRVVYSQPSCMHVVYSQPSCMHVAYGQPSCMRVVYSQPSCTHAHTSLQWAYGEFYDITPSPKADNELIITVKKGKKQNTMTFICDQRADLLTECLKFSGKFCGDRVKRYEKVHTYISENSVRSYVTHIYVKVYVYCIYVHTYICTCVMVWGQKLGGSKSTADLHS